MASLNYGTAFSPRELVRTQLLGDVAIIGAEVAVLFTSNLLFQVFAVGFFFDFCYMTNPPLPYLVLPCGRAVFRAPPGRVMLSADYRQMELRVMAFLAREGALWATLCDERRDPFREIAAGWLKRSPEQVRPRHILPPGPSTRRAAPCSCPMCATSDPPNRYCCNLSVLIASVSMFA